MGLMITLSRWLPFVWFVIAVALMALESATVNLIAVWFAFGALVAVIPALLGTPFWAQIVVFIAVGIIALIFTRPILMKKMKVKKTNTNADRVIGMIGMVLNRIDNVEGIGRVYVNGLDWSAKSDDGAPIEKDERVLIKEIRGATLIVERVI